MDTVTGDKVQAYLLRLSIDDKSFGKALLITGSILAILGTFALLRMIGR